MNNTNQFNYLAIQLLEKMGIFDPTQKQIDTIEDLLASCSLSEKEMTCLYWAACGKSALETAEVAEMSHSEIAIHREEVIRKLNSPNITQIVFEGMLYQGR